jgi:cobyrinic acid a,c-diamide synthase
VDLSDQVRDWRQFGIVAAADRAPRKEQPMSGVPRVVLAAPSSGHGKTAVAIGLLAALRQHGLRTAGFKIGPDYVDAGYLGLAADRPAHNLDPRMIGSTRVAPLFLHGAAGCEIAVVEGTMGLYDGLAGRTDTESTAQIAGLLRAPVVLVVDAAAMGQSVAALAHGFRGYDELLWLGGVILNRVTSDRHERLLRESLDDVGITVFGALRREQLAGAVLPPRAQGVVPVVQESVDARRAVRHLGEAVAAGVDLERLLALARSAPSLAAEPWSPLPDHGLLASLAGVATTTPEPAATGAAGEDTAAELRPVVAVAGGRRFSYGYGEVVEMLAAAGARVVPVDPLHDEGLPAGTAGLVIGGGLPEAYADELSGNLGLVRSVRALARAGGPILAEGVGLAFLIREYAGRPMVGLFDAAGVPGEQVALGYREATARSVSPFLPVGTSVIGYRRHRGLVTPRAGAHPAWSWPGGSPEGFVSGPIHASYLCLHWVGVPQIPQRFVAATHGSTSLGVAA